MQDFLLAFGKEIAVALVTAFGALFVWLIKHFFAERKRRLVAVEQAAKKERDKRDKQASDLMTALGGIKDMVRSSHESLKDRINEAEKTHIRDFGELRGKVEALAGQVAAANEGVSKVTGRVDDQVQMVATHISTISHLTKQIDALFRIVEAKKRTSDCQDPNGHAD